jgi:nucleoredoxin
MNRHSLRVGALPRILVSAVLSGLLFSCGGDNGIVEPEPPASLADLLGTVFHRADGSSVGIAAIQDKTFVAIYFSARGCPACGAFTPLLLQAYDDLEEAGRPFEVVLVSFESSAQDMFTYMTDLGMPWLAVPFGGEKAQALTLRYDVRWIPTLVVVDGQGRTVSVTGREEVAAKGAGAYDDWLAKSGG